MRMVMGSLEQDWFALVLWNGLKNMKYHRISVASWRESTMLLTIEDWNKVREAFTESEKASLNAAITGETICPRGCTLDEAMLGEALFSKLKEQLTILRMR